MPLGWTYLQSGDLPAARSTFERAEQLFGRLLRKSSGPKRRQCSYDLADVMRALAETGYYASDPDLGRSKAQDSVRLYAALVEEMPLLPAMHANLGEAYTKLGHVLQAQGEQAAALRAFTQARAIPTTLHEEEPGHSRWSTLLALDHLALARLSRQRGELAAAQPAVTGRRGRSRCHDRFSVHRAGCTSADPPRARPRARRSLHGRSTYDDHISLDPNATCIVSTSLESAGNDRLRIRCSRSKRVRE